MKERWEILEDFIVENKYRFIAEIGVRRGHIGEYLLPKYNKQLEKFYMIDIDDSVFERTLRVYEPIMVFHKMTSKEASKIVQDNLDLVFIDADHSYETVKEDIELWLPKIRKGGILCGHDYSPHCPGVVEAVDEKFGKDIAKITSPDVDIWWLYV